MSDSLAVPAKPALDAADRRAAGDEDAARRKNLLLLIQLRWIAVVGQIVTIAFVRLVLGVDLPLTAMAAVLIGLVGLNLVSLARLSWSARVANSELFAALILDIVALTAQFGLAGGATNPFTFLYLLQVTLSAVLLDLWSTAIVVTLTIVAFAVLTLVYIPLDLSQTSGVDLFSLHITGMVICFILDAALLVVFLTRITGNLRERDARLVALREQAAEEDHIVRLGLLASGAAHELGTPLSTVSVILNDWRRMPALAGNRDLMEDVEAMDAQLRRCKAILTDILTSAGETRSEAASMTTLDIFLDGLVEEWRAIRSVPNMDYANAVPPATPIVSDTALKQAIVNLLDNAFEASPDWIGLEARLEAGTLQLQIADAGPGFAAEIRPNIGKPYQSNKPRQGAGLGLFLVFNVMRKLGGQVEIADRPQGGAVVTVRLPLAALTFEEESDDVG